MDDAIELGNYLPLSFRSPKEPPQAFRGKPTPHCMTQMTIIRAMEWLCLKVSRKLPYGLLGLSDSNGLGLFDVCPSRAEVE